MTVRKELPVEPLSETAWRRIEVATFQELARRDNLRRVQEASARPRRRFVGMAAFAGVPLAAAAASLLLWWAQTPERGEPRDLRLTAREQATDTMVGDVYIHLEPRSALVVADHQGSSSLVLIEQGAAVFSVTPRVNRPAFVVRAGSVRVEVVGTRFRVERQGDTARVDTYQGVVRVLSAGISRSVSAGQTWPQAELPAQVADRAPEQTPVAETSDRTARPERPSATPPRISSRPPQDEPRDPNEIRRFLFDQASVLEASDPERALDIYQRLSTEPGDWAANALYAMGRLELERGHDANAQRLLQSYLDRYPQGANASDARSLVTRIEERSPVRK
jgi:hypothetical protein